MIETSATVVRLKGRDFNIKVIRDIDILLNQVTTDDDVPFWAILWPAAIGMAEYLWENMSFENKRVLELGAGSGLAGIVAASRGAMLVQSDFIPESLQLAKENAEINGINNITYTLGDWRNFPIAEEFDYILGSDILYEPKLHIYLRCIFHKNLKPGGCVVLADPGRQDAQRFVEQLGQEEYRIETVTKEVFDAVRWVKVNLYFVTRLCT